MPRNNVSSADNQQERLRTNVAWWITGFTDGEGCFSVSFIRNTTTKTGKQIFPEFVITQGSKSLEVLEAMQKYFHCGSIILNKRYDNHREHLYRYCVRAIPDLRTRIIPHFKKFPLKTSKKNDFKLFDKVISKIAGKRHLSKKGWGDIEKLAAKMNRKKVRS